MARAPSSSSGEFDREKVRVLEKADLSRKGSVDAPIRELVEYINTKDDYYTTSSCSGRAVVFCEKSGQRKKGCHWLLVSHDPITMESLVDACEKDSRSGHDSESTYVEYGIGEQGYTFLKFEPLVLHVMCRTMESAQAMLQVSVGSGFRNSGITCGKKGRVMLAVRSTHSLEVPLCQDRELLVTKQYLGHLVKLCNEKFAGNTQRIHRFFQQVMSLRSREHTSRAISTPRTEQAGRVKSGENRTKDTSLTHKTDDVIVNDCSPRELSFTDLFAES